MARRQHTAQMAAATRSHERLADQLRRQIVLKVIAPGQALPSERVLAQRFQCSRQTVQRALWLLRDEGLVEQRLGRYGGTFVLGAEETGDRRVAKALRGARTRVLEVLDYRLAVEPAVAAAAANRATASDAARLRAINDRLSGTSDDRMFERVDIEFHLALADVAANDLFREAVERVRLELDVPLRALPDTPGWHTRTCREHKVIIRAVAGGNEVSARTAMAKHLRHTDQSIRALLASIS